MKTKHNPE